MVTSDPHYGCSRCDNNNLPGHGYLDRLKKGKVQSKHQYSLQHHVETNHPEVTDWMSLKVNLGPVSRPGTRKRKPAQISTRSSRQRDDDDDEDDDDDDNDDAQGKMYQEETPSDSDDTKAAKILTKMARRPPSASAVGSRSGSSSPAPVTLSSVPTAMVPIAPFFFQEAQSIQVAPAPDPVAYLSTPVSVADLREQNIQLRSSNQDYRAVNEELRRQISGLLRAMSNVVAEDLHGFPLSTEAVQNSLMHFTVGNGRLVEQILARVVADLAAQRQPGSPLPAPISAQHRTSAERLEPSQSTRLATSPQITVSASAQSSPLSDSPSDMED